MLSTSVLLAALGICPYNRENALHREVRSDAAAERLRRMSSILRFGLESKNDTAETYSREALLKELSNDKFLSNVPEQVQALYHLLEHEFNPLEMCKNVDRLTEQLSDISVSTSTACPDISVDLSRHAPSLKFVAVLKMLQQLSQIYSNISTHFLVELVPSMDFGEIESIIVNAVKNRYIKVNVLFGSVFMSVFGRFEWITKIKFCILERIIWILIVLHDAFRRLQSDSVRSNR